MNKRAFTITEIVMVVVILGMLSAIALPKYFEDREQAKIDLTRQNLENLRLAIDFYRQTYNQWPSSDLSNVVLKTSAYGDRKFIEEIPLEAIKDSHAVKNSAFVDDMGGWLWDSSQHILKVNLSDHPTDPRRKYSEW